MMSRLASWICGLLGVASTAEDRSMNDDEKESLGLLTTEDLLGELSKRFDHLVFCGLIDRGQQEAAVCRHYRGNSHLCMGLAYDVAQLALDDLLDRASPDVPQGDGEDDEE